MKRYVISFYNNYDLPWCVSQWFSSDGGHVFYNCNKNSYFPTKEAAELYVEILKSV